MPIVGQNNRPVSAPIIHKVKKAKPTPVRTSAPAYHLPTNFHTDSQTDQAQHVPEKVAAAKGRQQLAQKRAASPVFGKPTAPTFGQTKARYQRNAAAGENQARAEAALKVKASNVIISGRGKSHDTHIGPFNLTAELQGRGILNKADNAVKPVLDAIQRKSYELSYGSKGAATAMHAEGLDANGNTTAKDITDLAANTPSGLYITGAAVKEAATGRPQRLEKLWKDYKATDALPALAGGHFAEAEARAKQHPVSTLLELSGVKAGFGRAGGAVERGAAAVKAAAKGKSTKAAVLAKTDRPNLRLRPGAKPGEGPEIQRRYSRDVINKAAQKVAESGQAKLTKQPEGQAARVIKRMGEEPASPRTERSIDTRVYSQARAAADRRAKAEREIHDITKPKALLNKRVPIKPSTRRKARSAAAGVQVVGEGVVRTTHIRADIAKRLGALARVRPTLEDPERLRLNRAESDHLRGLAKLSDAELSRVTEGGQKLAAQQVDVQARGHKAGSFTATGQSKRFYPALQSHVKRPKGEERAPLTPEQVKIAAKSVQQRYQKGKALPPKAKAAVAKKVGVNPKLVAGDVQLAKPSKLTSRFEAKPLKRGELATYAKSLKTRKAVPARPLNEEELPTVAKVLQRRARKGQSTLEGLTEGGPALITHRPGKGRQTSALAPDAPFEPTKGRSGKALTEGSREVGQSALFRHAVSTESQVTAAEGHNLLITEHGVDAGKDGRRYASTRNEAEATARKLMQYPVGHPNAGERIPHTEKLVPVNIDQLYTFGSRLKTRQAQGMPHVAGAHSPLSYTAINDMERQSLKDAWAAATSESGRGKWVLMPEGVVNRLRAHMDVTAHGSAHALTNIFKDVVLTSSAPARWLGNNAGDLTTRTVLAGITPADILRGRRIVHQAATMGLQGEQAAHAVAGGGLFHAAAALSSALRPRGIEENPVRTVLSAPWRAWKGGVYTLERHLEELPQYGAVGKSMRRETGRSVPRSKKNWGKEDVAMKRNLSSLLKLHDAQIDTYATKLATNRAFEARIQKTTEDVIGRWGKISPNLRRALIVAPFAQWLGAALRYVYVTLPVHHPIKTGIAAGISQMTQKERSALGLSYMLPRDKQVQDYQMGSLPTSVTHDKYGTEVKGIRTANTTSLGTAAGFPGNIAGFLLPQLSGPINAWAGHAYTGEMMTYPDWWPVVAERRQPLTQDDRDRVGLGALIESTVPFASAFRRALQEKGRPATNYSTVLTPAVTEKFDKQTNSWVESKGTQTGGILEWLEPIPPAQKLYTYGATKSIEESHITGETLDKWRAENTKPTGKYGFGGGTSPSTTAQRNAKTYGFGTATANQGATVPVTTTKKYGF